MTCPECGATQADEARFCSRCGTALLARRDEEPLSPAGDDEPMPVLDDTSDLDELLPFRGYPDVDRPGGGYADPEETGAGAPAGPADPDSRRGCLGMVALAMVGLLMLAGLLWYFGSGDEPDSPAAAPTTSSTTAPSADASPSDEASPSASASPTGPQPTERASTAKKCAELEGGVTAWSGNEVTTCDFAIETARALVAAGSTLPTTVTATSPVTKKDYEMECSNTTPVVCRGGTDALVYLDLSK